MRAELRPWPLYVQELRGLHRTRFALSGLAVFAVALTGLAMLVIPSPAGLWNFALAVVGVGPVLIGAIAALQMANLRASRLTHALYTLPVRSHTVLKAHVGVMLTLASLYLLTTIPFVGMTAAYVPVTADVLRLFVGGMILMVFATMVGTLAGVFFTGPSTAAPVGLTVAFLVLAMLAVPVNAVLQLEGTLHGSLLMRVVHMSPYVLVSDGMGLLEPSVAAEARSPGLALALVALQIAGTFGLTRWVFVREQSPDRWECGPTRRAALAGLAVALLLAVPLVAADDTYRSVEARDTSRYGSSSLTDGAWLAVVARGKAPDDAAFQDHRSGTSQEPLDATRPNPRDILVRLPVTPDQVVTNISVTFDPDAYLTTSTNGISLPRANALEHDDQGLLLRIPVVLTPHEPLELTGNMYQLWTNVTYTVDGTEQVGRVVSALEAEVPGAHARLGAAGAPLFLVATAGAIARRLRVE